jgi:ATP-dependent DNA ligase
MLQRSGRVAGLVEPSLPSTAKTPPTGSDWLHEIKHDGFRIMARRGDKGVRLITRNGYNFADRFSSRRGRDRGAAGALLPDRRRGNCQ